MAKLARFALAIVALIGAAIVFLPLLLPKPKAANGVSAHQLADADSRFVEIDGLSVHYKIAGHGGPLFVLMHGFLGSTENWRSLLHDLAKVGTVLAYDRPGFGLTDRPAKEEWGDTNPYTPEAQIGLLQKLIHHAGHERAILVGSSAGGTLALQTALTVPEAVESLILVAPAVYGPNGTPSWLKPVLATPQIRRLTFYLLHKWLGNEEVDLLTGAFHDPDKVNAEGLERNRRFTQVAQWDRALWDFTLASRQLDLPAQFQRLSVPTLIITGDNDRVVRTEFSLRLADELPGTQLVVIPQCGHLPQEECPTATVQAIMDFLYLVPEGTHD